MAENKKDKDTSDDLSSVVPAGGGLAADGTGRNNPRARSVGTPEDVATQGFSGTKVQADQQALRAVDSATHTGEGVPMGGNPLTSVYKQPDARPNTREFTVKENKFHFGGDKFSKGEKIHLTAEEYTRIRAHLVEQEAPSKDEGQRVVRSEGDKK